MRRSYIGGSDGLYLLFKVCDIWREYANTTSLLRVFRFYTDEVVIHALFLLPGSFGAPPIALVDEMELVAVLRSIVLDRRGRDDAIGRGSDSR